MPSGLGEILAKCMEPIQQYEILLEVIQAFNGHNFHNSRADFLRQARIKLQRADVWTAFKDDESANMIGWGQASAPLGYLTFGLRTISYDYAVQSNGKRLDLMRARNKDRRDIISNLSHPDVVRIEQMLSKYAELTYELRRVFDFGTKLYWDKAAIQSEYGLYSELPQNYPF